jgi:Arc/MetJ family transcription regulator
MASSSARKVTRARKRVGRTAVGEGKVRKEFWLDPEALAEAQAFLGTATERETVEVALELVAFRRDLAAAAQALKGLKLRRLD